MVPKRRSLPEGPAAALCSACAGQADNNRLSRRASQNRPARASRRLVAAGDADRAFAPAQVGIAELHRGGLAGNRIQGSLCEPRRIPERLQVHGRGDARRRGARACRHGTRRRQPGGANLLEKWCVFWDIIIF